MANELELAVLSLSHKAETGAITDKDRERFFKMVRELASAPLWRAARRQSGLAKFERETRRCVHPNGIHPRLAFTVEGTPEYAEHQALEERARGIFQRMRLECGT